VSLDEAEDAEQQACQHMSVCKHREMPQDYLAASASTHGHPNQWGTLVGHQGRTSNG
jgi:hypothetical protein